DRKSVAQGKRVDLGGRRIIKKKVTCLVAGSSGLVRARMLNFSRHSPLFTVHCYNNVMHQTLQSLAEFTAARLIVFSSRRRHTRLVSDWSSDVCSSDLILIWDRLQFLPPQIAEALVARL